MDADSAIRIMIQIFTIQIHNKMATKQEQIDFVKQVYPGAKNGYNNGGAHPLFVTAQAALETGWKVKGISNNIFGITKGSSWTGKTELVTTREVFNNPNVTFAPPEEIISIVRRTDGKYEYKVKRLFRAYDSIEQCLADHLKVLKLSHFSSAWKYRDDPREFVKQIQAGPKKYATDPNYVTVMVSVINMVEKLVKEIGI